LGKWFADTLFPPDEETASATKDTSGDELKSNNKRDGSDASVSLLVPQKGEPAGFVSLASHVCPQLHSRRTDRTTGLYHFETSFDKMLNNNFLPKP